MSGTDSTGKSFIEKTRTVVLNRRGAKILTKQALTVGASLQVAIPHLKRESSATVVWLADKQGEFQEVGIELKRTDEFWGIQFPGDTGAPRAAEEKEAPGFPAPFQQPAQAPRPKPAPEPAPVASLSGAEEPSALGSELVNSAFEKKIDEALKRFERQAEESLNRLQNEALLQTQDLLRRAVESTLEQLEKRAIELLAHNQKAWEQTLQGLASKAEEHFRARLTEHEGRVAKSAEKARQDLARKLAELSAALRG